MLLLFLACRVLPPKTGDDTSVAAPVEARAWQGPAGALLQASHPLAAGDRWTAAEGVTITVLDEAQAYADGPGPYALVDATGATRATADAVVVSLRLQPEALLLDPAEAGQIAVEADGAAPLTVYVDGAAIAATPVGEGLAGDFTVEGPSDGPALAQSTVVLGLSLIHI